MKYAGGIFCFMAGGEILISPLYGIGLFIVGMLMIWGPKWFTEPIFKKKP